MRRVFFCCVRHQSLSDSCAVFRREGFDSSLRLTGESCGFAPVEYGQGPIEIKYDHDRLTKVIYDQFVEDHFRGIECERNAVYAECNQHPTLGLMHYDFKHGTEFSPEVQRQFKKALPDNTPKTTCR